MGFFHLRHRDTEKTYFQKKKRGFTNNINSIVQENFGKHIVFMYCLKTKTKLITNEHFTDSTMFFLLFVNIARSMIKY